MLEWKIVVDQLHADTRAGVHCHERFPLPVVIDAELRCRSNGLQTDIGECVDYDIYCQMLRGYLYAQEHTDLVGQMIEDILVLSFRLFPVLDEAALTVHTFCDNRAARHVSLRARWARSDYERWCFPRRLPCERVQRTPSSSLDVDRVFEAPDGSGRRT